MGAKSPFSEVSFVEAGAGEGDESRLSGQAESFIVKYDPKSFPQATCEFRILFRFYFFVL